MTANGLADQTQRGAEETNAYTRDVHAPFEGSAAWVVAAPERSVLDASERTSHPGTHSETAANFFDVVFLSVALVAYSPALRSPVTPPRTTNDRASSARSSFLFREQGRLHKLHGTIVSISCRFPRRSAETTAVAHPTILRSLRASAPPRPPVPSQLYPTGPPMVPYISIRAWTSHYA